MNAFVSDTSDDNHICIRCKQTINGLHNYIEHRKSGDCEHMTADKFFNCLQLQYKYKYNEEEEERRSADSEQSYQNGSEDNSDEDHSEDEIDIYRPPKNFTGGKWKPGTHPQSNDRSNGGIASYICDSSSNDSEIFDTIIKSKSCEQSIQRCDESNERFTQIKSNNSKTLSKSQIISENLLKNNSPKAQNNENDLNCKLCGFIAKKSFDLLKHYLNESNHSTNDVFITDSIAKSESDLMRNLSFICEICSFYTNQSNNYFWHLTTSEHSLKSKSQTNFECKICDKTCDDVKNLMIHLEENQSIHSNSFGPLIVCKLRKAEQNSGNSFNYLDKRLDQFKCDFCLKIFKFKTHLKKHTMNEHIRRVAFPDLIKSNFIGDNPKYFCLKCDFKTDRESTHLLHSVNHEMPVLSNDKQIDRKNNTIKRSEDKYKCPLCDNHYICRELKKHINIHLNEKPFECIQCDKSFSKLVYLKSHEKIHSGIKDKICNICGTGFTLNKLLMTHIKIHDKNREKTVRCDICGAMFHTKYILLEHMKRHLPKSDRQFKCEFEGCRFAFVTRSELTEHSKVHSAPEEKQLLCDRCPYKTKSIFTLRKHYRQHTGEKRFECQFCNFKTYLSSNLCRHLRIHSGQKPYNCPYCSYCCNSQENIRKHILKTKKHIGLYVYPCTHCEFKTNIFSDYRKHIEEIHSDLYSNEELDALVSHLFKRN